MPSRLGHGLYKKIDRLKNIFIYSNIIIYYIESQLQNNEAGLEIVPADNGEAVIYHCIGPSTSSGKNSLRF